MTDPPERPWWKDLDLDWTHGNPLRLLNLLTAAYSERTAIASIAQAAGLDLPSQLGETVPVRDIWEQILKRAVVSQQISELIARLLDDQSGKESASLLAELFEPITEPDYGLEKIMTSDDDPIDADPYIEMQKQLKWRTAIISINGSGSGTGFLVGKELLLTAQHVVEVSRNVIAPLDSIEVVFDFSYQPGSSYDDTGIRVVVAGIICHSPPTDAERAGKSGMDWEATPDYLDFALLQLASPAPQVDADGEARLRGHYDIHFVPYRFRPGSILTLAHHPQAKFVKFSHITQPPTFNSRKTRIKYECDTLKGSSGGPIVNKKGRLVALHHYSSYEDNHGVPISAIAQDLKDRGLAYLFETVDQENVTHLGRYSASAREKICQAISDDWRFVTNHLTVPEFIADAYALWDWLSSHRKLRKLRSAFISAGRTDLARILDDDLIIADRTMITHINGLAEQLVDCVEATRGAGDVIASIMKAKMLTEALLRQISILPTWQDDNRLKLQWRTEWLVELGRISSTLDELARLLPSGVADIRRALYNMPKVAERSKEVKSAVTALRVLAQSPSLSA